MACLKLKLHNAYPRAIPLVAAMNISSLSLNPFSVSKQTEKYSELETWETREPEVKITFILLFKCPENWRHPK